MPPVFDYRRLFRNCRQVVKATQTRLQSSPQLSILSGLGPIGWTPEFFRLAKQDGRHVLPPTARFPVRVYPDISGGQVAKLMFGNLTRVRRPCVKISWLRRDVTLASMESWIVESLNLLRFIRSDLKFASPLLNVWK